MPHGIIFLKSENCGLADWYVLNENHSDIQNGQLLHLPTTNREHLPHNAAGILIKDSETRFCSGDHKFVQNNAAFLLANLSMSRVNLAVL